VPTRRLMCSVRRLRPCTLAKFAAAIALAATAVLCVRSYWIVNVADLYVWSSRQGAYFSAGIWTDRGLISAFHSNEGNPTGPNGIFKNGRPAVGFALRSRPVWENDRSLRPWFNFEPIERGDGVVGDWRLEIPFWAIAAALAVVFVPGGFKSWLRRARRRRGLCPACGYNLFASPGRCPECGANQNNRDDQNNRDASNPVRHACCSLADVWKMFGIIR
jgi:hypothetical protein